ncbi:MAG TPA: hypothetical protein VG672_15760 [Bryobacteraceae bacterium]|jgi:hypothetical protein|nr:hypothetical protein [Bryobacteraceae bacterium]
MNPTLPKLLLLVFSLAAGLSAQQPAAQPRNSAPLWDVRAILKEISAHAGRLVEALDKMDPKGWVSKGAPDGYVVQWNSAKVQAKALSDDAITLSRDPEKLSFALQTFFRMQALEYMLRSLEQGVRKYQSPALADLLGGLIGENGANRERLQTYITDLANDREQQFAVMDREAQRCRGFLAAQTPPRQPQKKEKK